jgi:hypothetical protein
MDQLIARVRSQMRGGTREFTMAIDVADGKAINFVETRAIVLHRVYEDSRVLLKVRIGLRQIDQLKSMAARFTILEPEAQDLLKPAREGWGE